MNQQPPPAERIYASVKLLDGTRLDGRWVLFVISGGAGVAVVNQVDGTVVPFSSVLVIESVKQGRNRS